MLLKQLLATTFDMSYRKISVVFAFLCISVPAFAEVPLNEYLPNDCVFSGKFSQQKYRPSLPVPINTTGNFFFSCHHGIIWQNNEPDIAKETLIFTNQEYHFRAAQNKALELELLNSPEIYSFASLLLALMKADSSYLQDSFELQVNVEKNVNRLTLLPKSFFLKKALAAVIVEKKNNVPFIQIQRVNGSQTKIQLSNLEAITESKLSSSEKSIDCVDTKILIPEFCSILKSPSGFAKELRSEED